MQANSDMDALWHPTPTPTPQQDAPVTGWRSLYPGWASMTAEEQQSSDTAWDRYTPDERERLIQRASEWKDGLAASLERLGYTNVADYLDFQREVYERAFSPAHPDPDATTSIGSRTANDLPTGPPPALIVDGILLPDNTTLMYGTGGTGKGVIAVVFVAILVREYGATVMVIDYENHPDEWGRRLNGVRFPDGTPMTEEEKSRVLYRSPYDVADWSEPTGSLHAVAMALREDCERREVDYVVVDSYSAATDGEEGMGGQKDAALFAKAMTQINRPSLVLAHIASSGERLPDKPFGSIHVRNLVARLMYALAQDGRSADEDEDTTDDTTGMLIAPTTIRVEMKRTKGNNYGRRTNRWIEVTFHPGGGITWDLDAKATEMPLWQQIERVLIENAPDAMTPEAVTKAINEDYPRDRPLKVNHIRASLSQHPAVFTVVDETKRPKTWSVRGSRAHTSVPVEGGLYVRSTPHNPAHTVRSVNAQSSAQPVSVSAQLSAQMDDA